MKLTDLLDSFKPIGLQGVSSPSVMSRYDTKFLLPNSVLQTLLQSFIPNYAILEIDGKRQHHYETLYFDTKDFKLYLDHHNGRPNRMKVRLRKYVTTNEVFFEVKHKLRSLQTGKLRMPRQKMMFELSSQEWQAVQSHNKNIHGLEKKLITTFDRITLSNNTSHDRITIDTNLCFNNFVSQKCLPQICIVEVKHQNPKLDDSLKKMFAGFNAKEAAFSKYAIGVALLESNVKNNLFKPTILQLQKLMNGLS